MKLNKIKDIALLVELHNWNPYFFHNLLIEWQTRIKLSLYLCIKMLYYWAIPYHPLFIRNRLHKVYKSKITKPENVYSIILDSNDESDQ